jgi:hypothetical protein
MWPPIMTDLDAILAQMAEGHWPRPTAALGRAIVERIRELERERDRYQTALEEIRELSASMRSDLVVACTAGHIAFRALISASPAPAAEEGGTG